MSARDELAKLLFITDNHSPDAERDWLHLKPYGPKYLRGYYDEADAVIAADYTKPRTITTAEELDALPVGSVILDDDESAAVKVEADRWELSGFSSIFRTDAIDVPATVLYEPAP